MRITSTSDVTPLAEYLPRVEFFPASDELRKPFVAIRLNHSGASIRISDPVDAEELISWGVAARDYLSTVNGNKPEREHSATGICTLAPDRPHADVGVCTACVELGLFDQNQP